MMLSPASGRVARHAVGAIPACVVTLLLVGSGFVTSAAMATEVDRNGGFLNKQCGAERHGCNWCTTNGCYTVTKCTETKCTITRGQPLVAAAPKRPPTASTAQRHSR